MIDDDDNQSFSNKLQLFLPEQNNMKLFIEEGSSLADITKVFSACYPFLKIEFYKKPSVVDATKKEVLPVTRPLIQPNNSKKTTLNIENNTTVAELENNFARLGLKAEVLRKCGNVWVETILTHNWTLQQQNHEGEEISKHYFCY